MKDEKIYSSWFNYRALSYIRFFPVNDAAKNTLEHCISSCNDYFNKTYLDFADPKVLNTKFKIYNHETKQIIVQIRSKYA